MHSEAPPRPTRAGSRELKSDSGETTFSAVSIPLPSDVPLSGARRSMVAYSTSSSSTGGCTTSPLSPKATTPIFALPGRRSTSAFATSLAASILVGSTSSAAILDDTSSASMTVPSIRGKRQRQLRAGRSQRQEGNCDQEDDGRYMPPSPCQCAGPFPNCAHGAQAGCVPAPLPL